MNKYKVEIVETQKYVVDVLAENEEKAKELATIEWKKLCESGTYHYHESGDSEIDFGLVFDVTNTDDPFNSE